MYIAGSIYISFLDTLPRGKQKSGTVGCRKYTLIFISSETAPWSRASARVLVRGAARMRLTHVSVQSRTSQSVESSPELHLAVAKATRLVRVGRALPVHPLARGAAVTDRLIGPGRYFPPRHTMRGEERDASACIRRHQAFRPSPRVRESRFRVYKEAPGFRPGPRVVTRGERAGRVELRRERVARTVHKLTREGNECTLQGVELRKRRFRVYKEAPDFRPSPASSKAR